MLILTTKEIEFIPTKEKDKEKPLTFFIKMPSMETSLKIQQIFTESARNYVKKEGEELKDIPIDSVKLVKTVLLDCVTGWKNAMYEDVNGELKELEFTKDNFMYLNDLEIILELFNKINELSSPPKKQEEKLN